MMQKYLIAYGAWLAGVLTMAGIALAWYKHVERIGVTELAARMAERTETDVDAE
jgi:hypothetical protein